MAMYPVATDEDQVLGYALKAAFGVAVKDEERCPDVKLEAAPNFDDAIVSVESDAEDDGYGVETEACSTEDDPADEGNEAFEGSEARDGRDRGRSMRRDAPSPRARCPGSPRAARRDDRPVSGPRATRRDDHPISGPRATRRDDHPVSGSRATRRDDHPLSPRATRRDDPISPAECLDSVKSPPRTPTPVLEVTPALEPVVVSPDEAPFYMEGVADAIDRARVNALVSAAKVVVPNDLLFAPEFVGKVMQAVGNFQDDVFQLLVPKLAGMVVAQHPVDKLDPDAPAEFSRSTVKWVRAAGATGEWLPAARAAERGPEADREQHAQLRALAALAIDDRASGPRRRHTFGIRVRDGGRGAQLVFASRCSKRAAASAAASIMTQASPQVGTSSSGRRCTRARLAALPPAPPPPASTAVRKRGRRGGRRAQRGAQGGSPGAAASSHCGPTNAQGQPLVHDEAARARERSRERAKRARRAERNQ